VLGIVVLCLRFFRCRSLELVLRNLGGCVVFLVIRSLLRNYIVLIPGFLLPLRIRARKVYNILGMGRSMPD